MSINQGSSLVDLKAELGKKRAASKQMKAHGNILTSGLKAESINKLGNFLKKDKKSSQIVTVGNDVDQEQLQKSRSTLEVKARLYEGLMTEEMSLENYEEDACLVDFRRKIDSNKKLRLESNAEESCSAKKSELNYNKCSSSLNSLDKDYKEESVGPVHYQNIQFNEIRNHGVGYFSFSKVEEERQKQMKTLHDLQKEVKTKQNLHWETERKRKGALDIRLSKICERRCIDKNFMKRNGAEESEKSFAPLSDVVASVETIPLPNDALASAKKQVRPWDIGKMPESCTKSQQNMKHHEHEEDCERSEEFAPPKIYFSN